MNTGIKKQFIPIVLTIATFFCLIGVLYFFISFLNFLPVQDKIQLVFIPASILVGVTIYLKTSIDFALFTGHQMRQNPGWKNRIAIEIGTALGNGLGTFLVLTVWTFFKEIPILLILMIFIAALVLFRMAEDGLNEFQIPNKFTGHWIFRVGNYLKLILHRINTPFSPFIKKILPSMSKKNISSKRSFVHLLLFAFTIPFVLGLDDFAGYIPLFSIINVFSFSVGVLFGHMILNLLLFASPSHTIKIVRYPPIIFFSSFVFVGIGLWGIWEVIQILGSFIFTFKF